VVVRLGPILRMGVCAAVLLLMFDVAQSFIGNRLLGKNLCVVGCGRGPLGIGIVDTALRGIGDGVFGPLLGIESAGNRVVDRADAKMAEKLKELNAVMDDKLSKLDGLLTDRTKALESLADNKIAELNGLAQDSLGSLDQVLKDQLQEGERVLERRFAALDVIGVKQQAAFEKLIHKLIVIAAVIVFLTFVLTQLWREHASRTLEWKKFLPRQIGWGGVGAAALTALYFALPTQYNLRKFEATFIENYRSSVNGLQFPAAAYYAAQLRTLNYESQQYLAYMDKATLLTDVFLRPTSYKTMEGLADLEQRVAQTLRKIRSDKLERDRDLEIVSAMLTWQARPDRFSRYLAASIAADAIPSKAEDPLPALAPLAIHYIRSYLAIPVADDELQLLGFAHYSADPDSVSDRWFSLRSNAELKKVLTSALARPSISGLSAEVGVLDPTVKLGPLTSKLASSDQLFPHMYYGERMFDLYRGVIPQYVEMVRAHAAAVAATAAEKPTHLKRRRELAKATVDGWDQWMAQLVDGPIDTTLNYRLAALGGLSATYTRAQFYLAAGDQEVTPPQLTKKEDLDKALHRRVMDRLVRGYSRPQSASFYRLAADKNFLVKEKLLQEFEVNFVELVKVVKSAPADATAMLSKAKEAGSRAAQLGLFSCKSAEVQTGPDSRCGEDEDPTQVFWLIRSMSPPLSTEKKLEPWIDFMKESLKTGLPVT